MVDALTRWRSERLNEPVARISGSHQVMRHPDGRTVVVPVHAGRDIAEGTLRNILAIIGMDAEEFQKLL
jgi:HicA toxin of bacterial toxin-antitoxin,